MKKSLLFLFLLSLLYSQEITLEYLKSKPKGIARDFYIWQFLQDPEVSTQDAIQAYDLIFRKNQKLEKLILQKGKVNELPKEVRCKNLPFKQLKEEDAECISLGLKLSEIPSLSFQESQALIQKLSNQSPLLAQEIAILSSKNVLAGAIESQNAQIFSDIFHGLKLDQRLRFFDHKIAPEQIQNLANQNYAGFNKMIQYVLLSDRFTYLKSSLLKANITQAEDKILILLGIFQLKEGNKKRAQDYFALAFNQSKSSFMKDKALFWQYLISKDQKLLEQLAQSNSLSLYTIFATQSLKVKPRYTIVSKLPNLKKGNPNFNVSDPFDWQILQGNLIKVPSAEDLKSILDQHLAYDISEPHMAVMLNRIKKFKNNYFLMPYSDLLSWKDDHQKALTFAIARQESNLLPALVSTSYALGMMQIMPFNLDPIAKALDKKNPTLNDLFDPQIALEFGRYYLQELEDEFKHPLFVAYAYNGGPGFLRRTLKKGMLFLQNRAYEPWLSLELIPYEESKNYGPLVLTNYIIYQELLGNSINLEDFLAKTLIHKTHSKEIKQ